MKILRKKHINEAADPTLGGVSYNVQGNPGYVYKIMNLTHDLEQKPNQESHEYYIYPGCTVRGVGVNNKELHYTGVVNRIVKDADGAIRYLYIRCPKTNRMVTILADDNLELILHNKPAELQNKEPFTIIPSHNIKI